MGLMMKTSAQPVFALLFKRSFPLYLARLIDCSQVISGTTDLRQYFGTTTVSHQNRRHVAPVIGLTHPLCGSKFIEAYGQNLGSQFRLNGLQLLSHHEATDAVNLTHGVSRNDDITKLVHQPLIEN